MVPSLPARFLQSRLLSTTKPSTPIITQVTRSNFPETLEQLKPQIFASQFVAVSLTNSGSFSSMWHRVYPFDTPETAYFKSRFSAERFQILNFSLCPFTVDRDFNVTAYPYNFHLFPRDELKIGMPSYSFSCQASFLTSLARQGVDFNTCIYDGISYLSRAQESETRVQLGNLVLAKDFSHSNSTLSTADAVFVERVKSRVRHWRSACTDSNNGTNEFLMRSLRKLVLGSEEYNSRPSMSIDVCTERQAQLIVEMLQNFSDDLVLLLVPAKGGSTHAIRVVLTSSKADKCLLLKELEELEVENNRKVRGFREVIDLISASQKPVVSHNFLDDLTFIYSKFIAPPPPNVDDFMSSLSLAFPQVIDVSHLMNAIGRHNKGKNVPVARCYSKNQLYPLVDVEIPDQAIANEEKRHGHTAVRISQLFANMSHALKIEPNSIGPDDSNLALSLEPYTNMFNPFSTNIQESSDGDIRIWRNNTRKVRCKNVVFLWGFSGGITAGLLKSLLQESHRTFAEEFHVRLVDKSCAIVVFWQPGLSKEFLDAMDGSTDIHGPLREMISEGLRAAGYETYKRACTLGLWETSLGESLDKALEDPGSFSESDPKVTGKSQWCSEWIINLDDL